MSLEMLWGEERKCSATVVGLDLVLALSKVRRCSLKRSFKRRLVSPILGDSLAVTSRSRRLGERLKATTGRWRKAFLQWSEERSRL